MADSHANGAAERADRSLEELIRVCKAQLEPGMGELPLQSAASEWLIKYAAYELIKGTCGSDGRSPHPNTAVNLTKSFGPDEREQAMVLQWRG